MEDKGITRLDTVMRLLGVSALELSRHCDVSASLISRWRKGERALTERSKALPSLAKALLAIDGENKLSEVIEAFSQEGGTSEEALSNYLAGVQLLGLDARVRPLEIQESGSYIASQQVYLGENGFRKAALLMLDYVMQLPPGQQIIVCAHNGFDLWLNNLPFALQFLNKLRKAVRRDTTFLLINRRGFGMDDNAHFAGFWLVAHLKGTMRSRYYEGEPPAEYFVAVIPGYWSGRVETDELAEDSMISTLYTDARNVVHDEKHCARYLAKGIQASQYHFLENPLGDEENKRGWYPGPLPKWMEQDAVDPTGSFSAICRVPSLGIMTQAEFSEVLRGDERPTSPDYLFRESDSFASGRYRLILSRDDIREALTKTRRQNEALSMLLHRKAFIPTTMLQRHLKLLLSEMKRNPDFEVALVPRSAFEKFELEIICWHNSASVAWLQDCSESVFANDSITSGSFSSAVNHAWGKLHKGWKRRRNVMAHLRKWIDGVDLDTHEEDSTTVKNWNLLL